MCFDVGLSWASMIILSVMIGRIYTGILFSIATKFYLSMFYKYHICHDIFNLMPCDKISQKMMAKFR